MNDPSHPRVDFDLLIREYLENLNVTLRAFKAADGHEFLDAFVPSDDPTLSLMDVVDLARDAKLARLTVLIGGETMAKVDLEQLQAAEGAVTRRGAGERTELEFSLS